MAKQTQKKQQRQEQRPAARFSQWFSKQPVAVKVAVVVGILAVIPAVITAIGAICVATLPLLLTPNPTQTPPPPTLTNTIVPTETFTPTPPTLTLTPTPSATTATATSRPTLTATPSSTPHIVGGMSEIPAGIFLRGSTLTDTQYFGTLCAKDPRLSCTAASFDDETPQRAVDLKTFWIDVDEVTNEQFLLFVQSTGYKTAAEKAGSSGVWDDVQRKIVTIEGADWRHPEGPTSSISDRTHYPVVHITWDEAQAYCAWVKKRLPTEAEWEKAARGTAGLQFPWGNEWDPQIMDVATEQRTPPLYPVGSFPLGTSPYGVENMIGNVVEWVADWYNPKYYQTGPLKDPLGPSNDLGDGRVIRGGSRATKVPFLHAAWRNSTKPDTHHNLLGFRCAKDP